MSLRVVVIDDHRAVAEAFASRLRVEDDVLNVVTVSDPDQALGVIERTQPDVVVWDVELGDRDGLALLRRSHERNPSIHNVVVTAHDDPLVAAVSLRAGAVAFVSKSSPTKELVRAVVGAAHGESHVDPALLFDVLPLLGRSSLEVANPRLDRLSAREREVLQHMVAGEDRAAIAEALYLSINTVRTHAKNILAKLEVHSTLEAVRLALDAGMRPPMPETDDDRSPRSATSG